MIYFINIIILNKSLKIQINTLKKLLKNPLIYIKNTYIKYINTIFYLHLSFHKNIKHTTVLLMQ